MDERTITVAGWDGIRVATALQRGGASPAQLRAIAAEYVGRPYAATEQGTLAARRDLQALYDEAARADG